MVTTRRMASRRRDGAVDGDVESASAAQAVSTSSRQAASGAKTSQAPARERFGAAVGWVAFTMLMAWRPLELSPIPAFVLKLAATAGFVYTGYKLVVFKRWGDEMKQLPNFLLWFGAAVVELAVENFFVWSVAAGNERKYDDSFVPLQDNVAIVAQALEQRSALAQFVLRWHWAHIANFLFSFLCIPFSVLWDQVPYSGFGIAARALAMHALVRVVRTASFLAVVMPNARSPKCYERKFAPPPDGMWDYMVAGFKSLRGSGGCNDLILSGHGCTWMMTVMTFWTFYPHGPMKYVFIAAYIQSSIRTAMEGWHYSVDFVLPAALCWYMYRDLAWVYPVGAAVPARRAGAPADPVSRQALVIVLVAVGFVILNAFFLGA